jgi:hypothetical protein
MESSQVEVTRRYSKYIFLDVVKFSQRSAEAQSEIVARLNEIVRNSLPLPAGEVVNHIDVKATVLFWTIADVYSGTGIVYGKLVPAVPAWQVARKPFEEQLASIGEIDFVVLLKFFVLITKALNKYKHYFEGGSMYEAFLFPNEKGAAKLEHSWPSIWQQFRLDEALPTPSEGEANNEL